MALEYKLVPDPENPGKYKAEAVNQKEFNLDDVLDEMMKSDRLKHLPRKEVRKIIESFHAYICLAQIDGKRVETPWLNVTDSGITPGSALQEVAKHIKVRKVDDEDS